MKSRCLLVFVVSFVVGCSSTPTDPTPPIVDPGPAVNNTPPVIGTFSVQGTRTSEPSNFADASEAVPVSVLVTDAESQISDLKFNWSADSGTFSGSGPSVTWTAPATVSTPATVKLNLEVVETYTSQGKSVQNKATGSTTLSLHDSIKEVGDMARQFLLDFSDSSIKDVSYVMRNFEPTCSGTADEAGQVAANRQLFNILEHKVGSPDTTVRFGGSCPFRTRPGDGCAQMSVYWKSMFLKDNPDSGNKTGDLTEAFGSDQVTAFYYINQQRWRLCDSDVDGSHTLKAFPRGLVP